MQNQERELAIFLSPHFDDIALSCGGMAARLARLGARCVCVTVFTAPASEGLPLSDYARGLHADWGSEEGDGGQAINEVRREEERQAMRLLGLEHVWLDLPDAPYRSGPGGEYFYTSDEELMGRVAPEERAKLVPWIAEQIRRVAKEHGGHGRVRVFAPLGVGQHVDHQLVFWVARRLRPRYGVLFYEDYPYAGRPDALGTRLAELGMPAQARLTDIGDLIGVKIAAIGRYKSQLGVLFGSEEAMPGAVRGYAQAVADGVEDVQYGERYWYVPPLYVVSEG